MLISGLFFFILGSSLLIKYFIFESKVETLGGISNSVIYIIQGIAFILLGYIHKRNEKYFIEWDEKELRYLLPKDKAIETITISYIKKVSIQLYEIEIELPNIKKTLCLENLLFKEISRIKEKFEEIKLIAERRSESI